MFNDEYFPFGNDDISEEEYKKLREQTINDTLNFKHERNKSQPCYVPDITAIDNYRLTCTNDPSNSIYRSLGLVCYTPQKAMEIGDKLEEYARELGETIGEHE